MKAERINLYFNPSNAFDLAILLLYKRESKGLSLSAFIKNVLSEQALQSFGNEVSSLMAEELRRQRGMKHKQANKSSQKASKGSAKRDPMLASESQEVLETSSDLDELESSSQVLVEDQVRSVQTASELDTAENLALLRSFKM